MFTVTGSAVGVNPHRNRGETGSILPIMAVFLVAAAAAIWGIATFGGLLIERAQARNAADAAALAAGLGSDEDARAIAATNGATLVSIKRLGTEVEVKVRLGRAHARARATIFVYRQPPGSQSAWIP